VRRSRDHSPVILYFLQTFSPTEMTRISRLHLLKCQNLLLFTFAFENAEGYVLIAVYLFMYLFICMCFIRITQKVLNRIACNLVGWLVIIRGPFDQILGSIGSKVKVMKRYRWRYALYRVPVLVFVMYLVFETGAQIKHWIIEKYNGHFFLNCCLVFVCCYY